MKFGITQKLKFKSAHGSYSIVKRRENFDSQITATDHESELLTVHFGYQNILVGNVMSNKEAAKKAFRKYPSGEIIYLNLVFPKPEKSELRLYLSSKAGFKPEPDDVWFIFLKDEEIWIGSMNASQWRSENSLLLYDESEGVYQDSIEEMDEIKRVKLNERDVFHRDRNLAIARFKQANFQCEFDPRHKLFISKHSKQPYLESHHLLPMALQNMTKKKLDTLDNIFCLCPYCHRAIHHSISESAIEIIDTLVMKRPSVLDILGISKSEIHKFYALEEIGDD